MYRTGLSFSIAGNISQKKKNTNKLQGEAVSTALTICVHLSPSRKATSESVVIGIKHLDKAKVVIQF